MLFKQNTSSGGILYDIDKIIKEKVENCEPQAWSKQGTDKTGRLPLPSIGALQTRLKKNFFSIKKFFLLCYMACKILIP